MSDSQSERRMLWRNIAYVLEWHDPDEQDFPWSYVTRNHGRLELFTTVLVYDDEFGVSGLADVISLGFVENKKEAGSRLSKYKRWAEAIARNFGCEAVI